MSDTTQDHKREKPNLERAERHRKSAKRYEVIIGKITILVDVSDNICLLVAGESVLPARSSFVSK